MITEDGRRTGPDIDLDDGARTRVLSARRRRPAGRAVVGGLLVALAALAAIVIATSGSGPPDVRVLVATTDVAPGVALGPDVLRVETMALPDELLATTFDDLDDLEGTVARSTLAAGELLQRGDVVAGTAAQRAAAPAREMSLHLDATRVGGGRLEPGDRVDVIATYGNGDDAFSVIVLLDAPIVDARSGDDTFGSARGVTLTLGLDTRAETIALAHALDVAQLSVVRTTTADADDEDPGTYRPALDDIDDDVDETDR